MRQNLQRNILEGTGRSVPKLHDGKFVIQMDQRCNAVLIEAMAAVCVVHALGEFLFRVIGEKA